MDRPTTYSHTSLALWRLCQRKWHDHYLLKQREPTTPNMAAGTWLAQEPIEKSHLWESVADETIGPIFFESCWANFLAEFGGSDDYDDPLFTPDLPKRILKAYQANPVVGKVVAIEERFWLEFPGGYRYQSKPDFVVEERECDSDPHSSDTENWLCCKQKPTRRMAWDIKLKTFNQSRAGDTFFLKPELSKFDDQGMSQAICAGCDGFGQIQFHIGKKDGSLHGPIYVEHQLDPILAEEWRDATAATILEIEGWLKRTHTAWPKNDQSCKAFGKVCHRLQACNFGFEPATLDNKPERS